MRNSHFVIATLVHFVILFLCKVSKRFSKALTPFTITILKGSCSKSFSSFYFIYFRFLLALRDRRSPSAHLRAEELREVSHVGTAGPSPERRISELRGFEVKSMKLLQALKLHKTKTIAEVGKRMSNAKFCIHLEMVKLCL